MDWQKLFSDKVRARGFDYYNAGAVEDFKKEGNNITASVLGNEVYDVEIILSGGRITDMYCSCPYASGGHTCKHMAAVLYRVDENSFEDTPSVDTLLGAENDSVKTLVENADAETVKRFLIDVLKKNEMLRETFKILCNPDISDTDVKILKKEIDAVCKRNTDRHGFISYSDARYFERELYEFLEEKAGALIQRGAYNPAFELIRYSFMKLCSVNIDDSDGVLSSLALVCADLWRDLFLLCGTDLKQAMYKQVKKILEKDIPDYMEEYIERVLFDNFSENDFLHDKLILCDTHIRLLSEPSSDSQNEPASYIESLFSTDDYNISKWVQYRIQVMKQLLFPQEDIDAYCKQYIGFTDIRTYYIEECIRTERLDEAIVLLDEGKELFKNLPGIVHKYSYILKDLYLKTNRAEDYKRELWNLVLKYARGDFEIYKELKILYTEDEWKNEREKIFACARNVYTLYDYEGLYDRILDKALHQDGLYYIIYYEDKIRDLDPEGILKKYEAVIRSMAEPVSGRAVYGEIAGYLKRMKSYSGGKEIVKGILEEFRIKYKNRPAMIDELSRVRV